MTHDERDVLSYDGYEMSEIERDLDKELARWEDACRDAEARAKWPTWRSWAGKQYKRVLAFLGG